MKIRPLLLLLASTLIVLVACTTSRAPEEGRAGVRRQALSGVVASYSFNEGTGTTVADGSSNANTGTLNGATWTASGKYGGALSFNGTSARVDVADSPSLDLTSTWTVAAWVRPTSTSGWRTVVMKEYAASVLGLSYALYSSNGAGVAWGGFSTTSTTRDLQAGSITANTWQHLAATYDGSTLRLYKDGAQTGSGAASGSAAVTTSGFKIGGNAVWGEYFAGTIDEVQVYSRALSAAEVVTVRDTPLGSVGGGGAGGTGSSGGAGSDSGGAGFSGGGAGGTGGSPPSANATLNGAVTYQVMDGFGTSINAHSWDGGAVIPALIDLDDMGTRIWRVVYEMTDWETTNDNADPAAFNWTSYEAIFTSASFEELWSTIAWLNAHGHTSGVMLDFMGRVPPWMGGADLNTSLKDEFVETVVAATYYGRVTRGLQFGMLAPSNETDHDGIEGPRIGAADYADVMNRVALRLDALGMADLKLVGPDTAEGGIGVNAYIPAMLQHPALMAHVDAFALHLYNPSTVDGVIERIAGSAYPNRHAWVTETSWFDSAWFQIGQGINAVLLWDGYDSVYQHAVLAGRGSSPPNDAGPGPAALAYSGGTYSKRDVFYEWKHLAKYIAPGMVRIGVTASSPFELYAFRHPVSGQLTILGRNTSGSAQVLSLNLGGLSSGPMQGFATNLSADWASLSVAVVGGVATATIPYSSKFTLVAGTAPDTTAPTLSLQQLVLTVSASDASGVAGVQFQVDGVNFGIEDTSAPYSTSWVPISGAHVLSAHARDTAGNVTTKSASIVVP